MSWFKKELKDDFPTFGYERGTGRPYHYLDSAASSLTPKPVLKAMDAYYRVYRSNVHRGLYRASARATAEYESAREKVAAFFGVSPEEIIFTRGTTESLNLAAYSIGPTLKEGDEVVLSIMEHHANLVPWQQMAKQYGFTVRFIPILPDYTLDMKEAQAIINERTRVLSVTHVSNALGTVNPVRELAELAKLQGATVIVDAAQSFGHRKVDPTELKCDLLALSGHKAYGPTGIGVLWGRKEVLDAMRPFLYGGEMILEVSKEDSEWNELPHKFEAGTPNVAGAVGLGAAVDYIESVGLDVMAHHEKELVDYALDRMSEIDGLRVIGPGRVPERGGAISFELAGVHPHDMAHILGGRGVCIRGGHHCAMPLMQELGLPGTSRASFGIYNDHHDVDALIEAIGHVRTKFNNNLSA